MLGTEWSPRRWLTIKAESAHPATATKVPTLKVQVEAGVDLNAKNENGDTALHVAVKLGFIEFVPAILKQGADPNVTDKQGQTPLFRAAFKSMERKRLQCYV